MTFKVIVVTICDVVFFITRCVQQFHGQTDVRVDVSGREQDTSAKSDQCIDMGKGGYRSSSPLVIEVVRILRNLGNLLSRIKKKCTSVKYQKLP